MLGVKAPLPENEAARLIALQRYQVLDTPREEAFDRITRLAARLFEAPMALVALMDADRQWWKSCIGIEGQGVPRDIAFCAYAILSSAPLVVEDARRDPRFADNPAVTGAPFVRFYAGAPLTSSDGFQLGTLCIVDSRPRRLTDAQLATLVDLSRIVVDELELRLSYQGLKAAERHQARSEELLAQRVQVLETILESAAEGIAVLDENAVYTVYNPAARRIVGEGPRVGDRAGAAVSHRVLRPGSEEPFPPHELPSRKALSGIPSDNVELLVRSPGRLDRLVSINGRPLRDPEGRSRGAVITFHDITALRAAQEELARRAVTDPLTGLPNRRAFDERLALLVAEGGRGRQFALVMCDIDHFKRVNDTHGHAVGDEVLAHMGKLLQRSVRCTDFVARFGGEEFCVLFSDVDEPLALRLADQLRASVAEARGSVPVTISLGVCANRPCERVEPSALLQAADRALYSAKSQGRNCVRAGQLTARESIPLVPSANARLTP